MVRAVMQTLGHVWASDVDLGTLAKTSARLSDLLSFNRVFAQACGPEQCYHQMHDAALARIHFVPAFIGSVILERLVDVDMVWRYRLGRCQWARLPVNSSTFLTYGTID